MEWLHHPKIEKASCVRFAEVVSTNLVSLHQDTCSHTNLSNMNSHYSRGLYMCPHSMIGNVDWQWTIFQRRPQGWFLSSHVCHRKVVQESVLATHTKASREFLQAPQGAWCFKQVFITHLAQEEIKDSIFLKCTRWSYYVGCTASSAELTMIIDTQSSPNLSGNLRGTTSEDLLLVLDQHEE